MRRRRSYGRATDVGTILSLMRRRIPSWGMGGYVGSVGSYSK